MKDIQDKFFQLLQLAIGSSCVIPRIEKKEWGAIYDNAKRQSLIALLFDGVQKMSDAAKAKGESVTMDVNLLMKWIGKCKQTENRNLLVKVAIGKTVDWFREKGAQTCILKGQGNALMYPCPGHRTAGDIDIWVSGKPSEVIRLVRSIAPKEKASYHHIDFPAIDGIPVEVHYRPCYLQNPLHNYRVQRFFTTHSDRQFTHFVDIAGNRVAIPTPEFNAVFQLAHIYNHLFQEGIGLRQIVDYHLNIEKLKDGNIEVLQRELKRLGLWKFAGAMMWVLHEVLGLSSDKMIAPMDENRGRLLLDEILSGGNFGQYSSQKRFGKGTIGHNIQRLRRDLRLVRYYPTEALAEPFFRVWHFFWRVSHR